MGAKAYRGSLCLAIICGDAFGQTEMLKPKSSQGGAVPAPEPFAVGVPSSLQALFDALVNLPTEGESHVGPLANHMSRCQNPRQTLEIVAGLSART
jgi:hypothetical protein